jgi:hypothetical protein
MTMATPPPDRPQDPEGGIRARVATVVIGDLDGNGRATRIRAAQADDHPDRITRVVIYTDRAGRLAGIRLATPHDVGG